LRWIRFHTQHFDDNGIPCAILLQALSSSDDKHHEPINEYLYNEQDIKEICGCLVTVSPGYGFRLHDIDKVLTHEQIPIVSFAHYTVREFLDSDRISTSTVAFFMLENQIQLDIQRRILLNALKFEPSYVEDLDLGDDPEDSTVKIFRYLTGRFYSYCAASAIFSISLHPGEITSHQDLNDHVFDMLNPCGAHAESTMHFLDLCQSSLLLISETHGKHNLSILPELQIEWTSTDEPSRAVECAMGVFLILRLFENFEPLVEGLFRKTQQNRDVMHATLRFGVWEEDDDENKVWCEFDGRMVEFFAQARDGYWEGGPLEFILDQGTTPDNPTAILYSYVGRSRRYTDDDDEHPGPRLLNRILELGCNTKGEGYTTTPLQMAVAKFDYIDAEILLRAGADANGLGDLDGIRWSGIFGNFKDLEGMSPLYICQDGSRKAASEDKREMLEALLLQHGAESFATAQPPSSDGDEGCSSDSEGSGTEQEDSEED
jgi:hypothetical protein